MNPVIAKRDIGLMLFIIAVCIAVLIESWDLPPGTFEPLGSGPVPQAIAFVIIGLCTIILGRAIITLVKHNGDKTSEEDELSPEEADSGFRPRPWSAVAVLLFSLLYVGILYLGIAGFGILTTIFIFGIIVFLIGMDSMRAFVRLITTFDRTHLAAAKPVLIAAIIAVIMGFGCEIVFTEIFYVDLPTG